MRFPISDFRSLTTADRPLPTALSRPPPSAFRLLPVHQPQPLYAGRADHAIDFPAALQHDEAGDVLDAISRNKLLVLVNVHSPHRVTLARQRVNHGLHCLTWAAPVGIEIQQDMGRRGDGPDFCVGKNGTAPLTLVDSPQAPAADRRTTERRPPRQTPPSKSDRAQSLSSDARIRRLQVASGQWSVVGNPSSFILHPSPLIPA